MILRYYCIRHLFYLCATINTTVLLLVYSVLSYKFRFTHNKFGSERWLLIVPWSSILYLFNTYSTVDRTGWRCSAYLDASKQECATQQCEVRAHPTDGNSSPSSHAYFIARARSWAVQWTASMRPWKPYSTVNRGNGEFRRWPSSLTKRWCLNLVACFRSCLPWHPCDLLDCLQCLRQRTLYRHNYLERQRESERETESERARISRMRACGR